MRKMNGNGRRVPSLEQTAKYAEGFGWYTERLDGDRVILERGRQRIVARRFPDGMWKVEYFSGKIMDDMSGITTAGLAKRELAEMAMSK